MKDKMEPMIDYLSSLLENYSDTEAGDTDREYDADGMPAGEFEDCP